MGYDSYVATEREMNGIGGVRDISPTLLFRFRMPGFVPDFDAIEAELGLPPLRAFLSFSAEDQKKWADAYEYELENSAVAPEVWVEPAEAMVTLRGLLVYMNAHPEIRGAADFIEAIQDTADILQTLQARSVRFHFAIVAP